MATGCGSRATLLLAVVIAVSVLGGLTGGPSVASAAAGADRWGTPVGVTRAEGAAGWPRSPAVAVDSRGDVLVGWTSATGSYVRMRPAGGRWLRPRRLAGGGGLIGMDARGRSLIVWSTGYGGYPGAIYAVGVDPRGRPGRIRRLDDRGADPTLAVASSGQAVVAWDRGGRTPMNGLAPQTVIVSTGHLGGSLSAGRVVSAPSSPGIGSPEPSAAIASDGSAVVAWQQREGSDLRAEAVVRAPGGSFGPARPISLSAPVVRDTVAAAISAGGRPAVAWSRSRQCPGDPTCRPNVEVALGAPGGGFEQPTALSTGGSSVELAFLPGDRLAAGWVLNGRVMVAFADRSGRWSAVSAVSPAPRSDTAGAYHLRLAPGPRGEAVAVWERQTEWFPGWRTIVEASAGAPGEDFQPARPVSSTYSQSVRLSAGPLVIAAAGGVVAATWVAGGVEASGLGLVLGPSPEDRVPPRLSGIRLPAVSGRRAVLSVRSTEPVTLRVAFDWDKDRDHCEYEYERLLVVRVRKFRLRRGLNRIPIGSDLAHALPRRANLLLLTAQDRSGNSTVSNSWLDLPVRPRPCPTDPALLDPVR